jgi:hypothetical protein
MKQPEYTEGPEALENFKRLATTVLRAAKRGKLKDKPTVSRKKAKSSDKDWKGTLPADGGWPTFTFFVKVGTTNPPISPLLNLTFDAFPNWNRIAGPSALFLTFRLHA